MSSYIIRGIDPGLWARVKIRAARDQRPIRAIIIELLEWYADRGRPATAAAGRKSHGRRDA